jgi:hypothetical protein
MRTLAEPGKDRFNGVAVVLCALPVEYLAMQAHLTGLQQRKHPAGTEFAVGKLKRGDWQVGRPQAR